MMRLRLAASALAAIPILVPSTLQTAAATGDTRLSLGNSSAAAAQAPLPVWPKAHFFWYRRSVPGGNVWIGIDAEHGVREPLFDHQRLAIEMSLRTGVEFEPLTLPFAEPGRQFVVKYDGSNAYIQEGAMAIEFNHNDQHWRCELQIKWDWNKVPPTDYECLARRPVQPGEQGAELQPVDESQPVLSPDGRWQAFVRNYNIHLAPANGLAATPVALSSSGVAGFAYLRGSILWSQDSRSVTAYRVSSEVWNSDALSGTVKQLVQTGEWRVPGER